MEQAALTVVPQCPVAIRSATPGDLSFMDALQKKYGRALGYFPMRQFEEYVNTGGVLIAEEAENGRLGSGVGEGSGSEEVHPNHSHHPDHNPLRIGYCISRDRYLKRDELGVVYQLCVMPGVQRKLVGAALVREVFQRSAYGCRLYCCWCAQDLDANYFWQSLGFVPIAFRAGGRARRGKESPSSSLAACPSPLASRPLPLAPSVPSARVHIFWQKRINEGDETTPYWYPFQTSSGAIREDRLVFPIPPGVHWKDVQAVELPRGAGLQPALAARETQKHEPKARAARKPTMQSLQPPAGKVAIVVSGRIRYVDRPGYVTPPAESASLSRALSSLARLPMLPAPTRAKADKARKTRSPTGKIDSKYLSAARELRDRYLEYLNGEYLNGEYLNQRHLNGPHLNGAQLNDPRQARQSLANGKYDVRRLPAPKSKRATRTLAA